MWQGTCSDPAVQCCIFTNLHNAFPGTVAVLGTKGIVA